MQNCHYVTLAILAFFVAANHALADDEIDAARRAQSMNNLKQFALAMHNYHDTNGKFPAASSFDKDGKPLLSWRVHVLPYLEQAELYKQFHLDEPWDSEHNKKLIEKMPNVLASPWPS